MTACGTLASGCWPIGSAFFLMSCIVLIAIVRSDSPLSKSVSKIIFSRCAKYKLAYNTSILNEQRYFSGKL